MSILIQWYYLYGYAISTKEMRMSCEGLGEVKERLAGIEGKLEVYNKLLEVHIEATNILKEDVAEQRTQTTDIIKMVFEQSDKNQAALNRQLKLSIGVFAAIAGLVTALAAWISAGTPGLGG
jgi:hypothetical protein